MGGVQSVGALIRSCVVNSTRLRPSVCCDTLSVPAYEINIIRARYISQLCYFHETLTIISVYLFHITFKNSTLVQPWCCKKTMLFFLAFHGLPEQPTWWKPNPAAMKEDISVQTEDAAAFIHTFSTACGSFSVQKHWTSGCYRILCQLVYLVCSSKVNS